MNTVNAFRRLLSVAVCSAMLSGSLVQADASTGEKLCEHHSHVAECTAVSSECGYVCTTCVSEVQGMINSLVPMTAITSANKVNVKASLVEIDKKMESLSKEAVKSLDLKKYNEAYVVCNAPEKMAIGKMTSQFASYSGKAPEVQFSFVDQNKSPAKLSYASNLLSTEKITVPSGRSSEYFYLPAGSYHVSDALTGSWHSEITFKGKVTDDITVSSGEVFSINAVFTGLKVITGINQIPQDTSLTEYKATAPSVISGLASKINVTLEGGAAVDLPIVWVCEKYNASPNEKNTFSWSVNENELTKKYDASLVKLSGSIQVTNAPSVAVVNSASDTARVYDGSKIDVSEMFVKDVNGGSATYTLTGGTGMGTLSGSLLDVESCGTFEVRLNTAANGAYGAGEITAVLTVSKASGTGSVSADDFAYGDSSWSPTAVSETNGSQNVSFFYKPKDSDDSAYSSSVPNLPGAYTVKAVFAENGLYSEVTATADFEITKSGLAVKQGDEPSSRRSRKRSRLSDIEIIPGTILNSEGAVVDGTYIWAEPDKIILKDGNEKAIFTPYDTNYAALELEIEVDVYTAYDNSTLSGTTTVFSVYFYTDDDEIAGIERVQSGKRVPKPADPVKKGYEFEGWYTDSRLKNKYDFSTKVTESFSLIAKWSEEEPEAPDYEYDVDDCRGTRSDGCPSCEFYDLNTREWYHNGIDYALTNGIMNGTEKNIFDPEGELTRAMLVTILYRVEGEPRISVSSGFSDVPGGSWYSKAVAWAKANRIVNGENAYSFAPEDSITREDLATIIYRYAVYKGYDVSDGENTNILSYDDFHEISNYAVSAFQYVAGAGIMSGKGSSTLNPKDNTTRAEAATILYRLNNSINK